MKILISIGKNASPVNYVQAVLRAGGLPVAQYLPAADSSCGGLILAGGGDVEPSLYGEENRASREIDLPRDRAELALLDAFARAGKPVLAICRGHQIVNVWAGGGLIQDLGVRNAVHRYADRDRSHMVLTDDGILRELYGERFRGNSAHHQAVGDLGRELRVTARSEDGVIEGMEHRCLPIWTVQFHPERMDGTDGADGGALFRRFMKRCNVN